MGGGVGRSGWGVVLISLGGGGGGGGGMGGIVDGCMVVIVDIRCYDMI